MTHAFNRQIPGEKQRSVDSCWQFISSQRWSRQPGIELAWETQTAPGGKGQVAQKGHFQMPGGIFRCLEEYFQMLGGHLQMLGGHLQMSGPARSIDCELWRGVSSGSVCLTQRSTRSSPGLSGGCYRPENEFSQDARIPGNRRWGCCEEDMKEGPRHPVISVKRLRGSGKGDCQLATSVLVTFPAG